MLHSGYFFWLPLFLPHRKISVYLMRHKLQDLLTGSSSCALLSNKFAAVARLLSPLFLISSLRWFVALTISRKQTKEQSEKGCRARPSLRVRKICYSFAALLFFHSGADGDGVEPQLILPSGNNTFCSLLSRASSPPRGCIVDGRHSWQW